MNEWIKSAIACQANGIYVTERGGGREREKEEEEEKEEKERTNEMFYLTTHSTHFIYGYMASDIW